MSNPAELQAQTTQSIKLGAAQASAASQLQQQQQQPKDRFEKSLDEIKRGSALGVNVQEAVKASTKGHHNLTHDIRLSIKRQYYTTKQMMQTFIWGAVVGAFVGALLVAQTAPNAMMLMTGPAAPQIWGIFMISFGAAALVLRSFTHPSIRKCSKDSKYDVKPEFQGRDCLEDLDCTDQETPPWGACKVPKFGVVSRSVQNIIPPLALFAGLVLFFITRSGTDIRPHPTDVTQASVYGMFAGGMAMFFFSFTFL